jgi:hypothetical protein
MLHIPLSSKTLLTFSNRKCSLTVLHATQEACSLASHQLNHGDGAASQVGALQVVESNVWHVRLLLLHASNVQGIGLPIG